MVEYMEPAFGCMNRSADFSSSPLVVEQAVVFVTEAESMVQRRRDLRAVVVAALRA